MSIDASGFIPAARAVEASQSTSLPSSSFENWLGAQLNNVNDTLVQAERQVQRLAIGDVENLHQVMISLEEAKLTFQLAMQIRNRVLEAYQEVMRMQV